MLKLFFAIFLCLLAVSCAPKKKPIVKAPVDFVSQTLGEAAEQAHSDLAMLAKLRGQGVQPLLPPPAPDLMKETTISWTGPAAGALKEICLAVGYQYREFGTPSAQPLTVIVRGTNRVAYELLEDIAWQVQPQAMVKVDPFNRVITLARTSAVGGM